jgi:CRP-like cAMP-binding protein
MCATVQRIRPPARTVLDVTRSTTSRHAAGENHLLAGMPRRGQQRFLAGCEQVELHVANVLCELGERIRHVYFPTESFVSLVTVLGDGARLEVGIVGNEGMLGTSLMLGVNASPQHVLVQGAGTALRMSAPMFQRHYRQSSELRRRLSLYLHVSIQQLALTAACTHYHLVEARLARWLLLSRDRAHCDQFHLTHEFLAYMLGVRRAGVTNAANSLQEQGLIDYSRGAINILDNKGLQRASCVCYRNGNEMYDHVLGSPRAAKRGRRQAERAVTRAP